MKKNNRNSDLKCEQIDIDLGFERHNTFTFTTQNIINK